MRRKQQVSKVKIVYNPAPDADVRLRKVYELLLRPVIDGPASAKDEQISSAQREDCDNDEGKSRRSGTVENEANGVRT